MSDDSRLAQLHAWLAPQLPALFSRQGWGEVPPLTLVPASSDASFRRFFRWQMPTRSLIVMDAPPPRENSQPFVQVADLLAGGGLNVPHIYLADLPQGFLLLSDLGRDTYLNVIDASGADALFDAAIRALVQLQHIDASALPAYDDALLRRELELFPEWYLARHLGRSLDAAQAAAWAQVVQVLVDNALVQPRVLVHRDYMPRNLMISTPNPGVLDFQDAVQGPVTYDITCLFKDAFVSWPEERVLGWLEHYWRLAREQGVPVQEHWEDFLRASDLMGVQRHLKVIGIFARLCHRDGKPGYLTDVPRFFAYIDAVLARRPELAALGDLFDALAVRP